MSQRKSDGEITIQDGTVRIVDVRMGHNVAYYGFVNLYCCTIGDDTRIGAFVEIQRNASIGQRCKVSSHSFICEGVHIGDDVFIGHGVMFTNDKYPRATIEGRPISTEWSMLETFVEDGVSIGSGATLLCGIRIGRGALIGAGAVVTRDVAAGTTVVGNPARLLRNEESI